MSLGEQYLGLPLLKAMQILLTVPSAAKALGVRPQRVYQLIEEGALRAGRLTDGNDHLVGVMVLRADVDAYLEYRKKRAAVVKPSFA